MTENRELPPWGRLLFGSIFILAGGFIFLVGLGVIEPDPRSIKAPLWAIALVGLAFLLAGASVALGAASPKVAQDGSLPASAPLALRAMQLACGLIVIAALATVFSYIAFAPGPRPFKVTVSMLGLGWLGGAYETAGRIAFGLVAVLGWLFFIGAAIQGVRKLRATPRREPGASSV